MPKKSTPARSGVQRAKPKTQKSFELVRPTSQVQELEEEKVVTTAEDSATETTSTTSTTSTIPTTVESSSSLDALPTVPQKRARVGRVATEIAPVLPVVPKATKETVEAPVAPVAIAAKGNASARLAARKHTQRSSRSASLITAEHYSYVRKDLLFIAVLAIIMFAAIIVLYFVPGIGA